MHHFEEENIRMMETIEEKEHCIDNILVVTDFIKCLNRFKNKEGYGEEGNLILFYQDFDDDDEWKQYRCKEDEVALIMFYPAADEDTFGYMHFKQFYSYVYHYGQKYIQEHPEKKEEVTRLLNEIKESWGI